MPGKPLEGQSPEYRAIREKLLAAEIELKDQRERVAELRRQLPLGPAVKTDYVFREGPRDFSRNIPSDFFDTRLSELFAECKDELIVQHMMYAPEAEAGCPMCSMWADAFDAVVPHLNDRTSFVIIARADIATLRDWARRRGWRNVRLLSSHDCTFNEDYNVEIEPARQLPAMSVFVRSGDGKIHHAYMTEASLVETHHRGIDFCSPVWNLLDLLPSGRGNWMPQLFYD